MRALQHAGNPKELDMGTGGWQREDQAHAQGRHQTPPDVHRLGKQHSRAL